MLQLAAGLESYFQPGGILSAVSICLREYINIEAACSYNS